MASDFSIAQFRFLERLLVVHGHWCYKRIAQMVQINKHFHLCFLQLFIVICHKYLCKLMILWFSDGPLSDLLFLLQKYSFWPHTILLRDIYWLLRAVSVWWLVYATVQCHSHIIASNIIGSIWARCFFWSLLTGILAIIFGLRTKAILAMIGIQSWLLVNFSM